MDCRLAMDCSWQATISGQQRTMLTQLRPAFVLLLGFTLALALPRYDLRRQLIVDESNAIGATDLRAQMLPEPARTKLLSMLQAPQTNVYTIENRGIRKIIRQSPWFKDGVFSGVVEISFEIPDAMAHHVRL